MKRKSALFALKPVSIQVHERVKTVDLRGGGWRLGDIGTFGVVACVQEVAVTLGELLRPKG